VKRAEAHREPQTPAFMARETVAQTPPTIAFRRALKAFTQKLE
jgi:hypothetical protein